MAEIYLMHPRHGVKIATMEMEAQYDEMHGWVRFDPNEPDLSSAEVEVNVFSDTPRRRGRPRLTQED